MPDTKRRDDAILAAVEDFKRYLGDEIAPLMALDSIETLLGQPPEAAARAIYDWVDAQTRGPADTPVPVAGYIYHAVKKLHLFSEFDLIDTRQLERYLSTVARLVTQFCPEADRTELKLRLSQLGRSETTLAAPVKLLHQEKEATREEADLASADVAEQDAGADPAREIAGDSPRFRLLMTRLQAAPGASATPDSPADSADAARAVETISVRKDLIAQLISQAALESSSGDEFRALVARLREQGIEAELGEVFRTLGRALPGWTVSDDAAGEGGAAPSNRSIEAMRRIVAMAGSEKEGLERFSELIYAAIEQFNEGHLAQAVAMFDLATTLVDGAGVGPEMSTTVRGRAQTSVSIRSMRRFAGNPDKHDLLRRVLEFFPAFTAEGLLTRLESEAKRDNRKLMLSLIEVHGTECRNLILNRLIDSVGRSDTDVEGFSKRNLIYLLRRIPAADETRLDEEFSTLCRALQPGEAPLLVKEALGALGQIAHADAERTLIRAVGDLETSLTGPVGAAYSTDAAWELLDRACAALARRGSIDAIRTVVHHAFQRDPALGPTMQRIEHLATHDLSVDPEQLSNLIEALKNLLPRRVLGLVVRRDAGTILSLIRALSGTPAPAVRELYADLTRRFPGRDFAEAAAADLARFDAHHRERRETSASADLSGDVELFGLPNLFQSISESRLSGELTFADRHGHRRGRLIFVEGAIRLCETGPLRGEDAVCQLFEQPEPGSFRFRKSAVVEAAATSGDLDTMPLVLEALRRYDEFQLARAIVPDGACLVGTGTRPRRPEEEDDAAFLRRVWAEAARGTPPEICESTVRADAFRVRRLYALWLEQGALKPRPSVVRGDGSPDDQEST